MAKTNVQIIEAMLGRLSLDEVRELHRTPHELEALLEAHAMVAEGQDPPGDATTRRLRDFIEYKLIPNKQETRKYGPYAYLRVWRNGKHTSQYLGKVKPT